MSITLTIAQDRSRAYAPALFATNSQSNGQASALIAGMSSSPTGTNLFNLSTTIATPTGSRPNMWASIR